MRDLVLLCVWLCAAACVCAQSSQAPISASAISELYRCVRGSQKHPVTVIALQYADATRSEYITRMGNTTIKLWPHKTIVEITEPQWIYASEESTEKVYLLQPADAETVRCDGLASSDFFRGCALCARVFNVAVVCIPGLMMLAVMGTILYVAVANLRRKWKKQHNKSNLL